MIHFDKYTQTNTHHTHIQIDYVSSVTSHKYFIRLIYSFLNTNSLFLFAFIFLLLF